MGQSQQLRGFDIRAPSYTPNRLLNVVAERLNVKHDRALSLALDYSHPQLSRIRHRKNPVSALLLVQILDRTDLTMKELRRLMGVPFAAATLDDPDAPVIAHP